MEKDTYICEKEQDLIEILILYLIFLLKVLIGQEY